MRRQLPNLGFSVFVSVLILFGSVITVLASPGDDCNGNGVPDGLEVVATFQGLGDLSGGVSFSQASAVSGNGLVVVGVSDSTSGNEAFRWTRGGGMAGLGHLPGSTEGSAASDVSNDGSVVVGASGGEAFRWTAGTGMSGLGSSSTVAVSADGSLIVGGKCVCFGFGCFCFGFRWTLEEGMVGLGFDAAATGVSADGSVVVGYGLWDPGVCDCTAGPGCGFTTAFRWSTGTEFPTLFSAGRCSSRATGVSADGSFVIGDADGFPFRWAAGDGKVTSLGLVPSGISADGSVVVGWAGQNNEAKMWDEHDGTRSLRAILVNQYGLDLTGWTLTRALDVSSDGRTIVGWGTNPGGLTEAWIATLPGPDCNANGIPDECDIADGATRDCNADAVPDGCQPGLDSDGDGFLDSCDACGQSNKQETLRIGGCETGVANSPGSEGCTLADELSGACAAPTGKSAHGEFMKCVARLTDDWRRAERIGSSDGGRIILCAARP